jgi:hypothetical protein
MGKTPYCSYITMVLCGNIQGQASDIAAEDEQEIDGRFSASSAPRTKKGGRVGDILQMNLIGMNYKMFCETLGPVVI